MTTVFLFPGEGVQNEGLLHHLPQHVEVTRTIEEANDVLGLDMSALDNAEALHSTAAVQPALLIAGVATARALVAEKVHPAAVAGMSVGAFGAAVACGTLSFPDALQLVRLRGKMMQEAFPSGYGLAAIEGLDEASVENIVKRIRTAEFPVYLSNINSPRQIVIAGSDAALDAVTIRASQKGARRAKRLDVSVPSHCPLLQPVADRLEQLMAGLSLRPPSIPYMSNRGGRTVYDFESIRQDLATGVAYPVRWWDSLQVMHELGADLFLEMSPGHVSTSLVAELFPDERAVSIADQGLRYAWFSAESLIQGVLNTGSWIVILVIPIGQGALGTGDEILTTAGKKP
jgi:malonate decarboxylase epsilon subunit